MSKFFAGPNRVHNSVTNMKEQIDSQYRRPLKASITSTDQPSLQARHEIRYLENLYGNAIDYSSHVNRRELREAFSLILFFGLLLLAAVNITYVMEWALQSITRALGY